MNSLPSEERHLYPSGAVEFTRKRHSGDLKFKFIFVIRTEDRKASTSNDAKKVIVRLLAKKIHTGNIKSNKGKAICL
jgi:hypothetical protein